MIVFGVPLALVLIWTKSDHPIIYTLLMFFMLFAWVARVGVSV